MKQIYEQVSSVNVPFRHLSTRAAVVFCLSFQKGRGWWSTDNIDGDLFFLCFHYTAVTDMEVEAGINSIGHCVH